MARRYWLKVEGEKLTDDAMKTLAHAEAAARHVAQRLRKAVIVGYDDIKPKVRRMKRNPDPGSFVDYYRQQEIGRRQRLDYLAATKPKRLAKGQQARRKPRGGSKAGFAIDVHNDSEAYTFAAPTRSAADALARQYRAAGFYAEVSAL